MNLLVSTRNAHKVAEIRAILGEQFDYHTLTEFPGAPRVSEDAPDFAGNAIKKAVELARWVESGAGAKLSPPAFVLADDSGLEVDALHGAPGVHSARFAAIEKGAENSSDAENCAKLLQLLQGVPLEGRGARFRCVIALTPIARVGGESETRVFEGICEGRIGFELRGQGGFGYDPLFFPLGYEKTFAELSEANKNQISHRARALAGLKDWFRDQYATRTR